MYLFGVFSIVTLITLFLLFLSVQRELYKILLSAQVPYSPGGIRVKYARINSVGLTYGSCRRQDLLVVDPVPKLFCLTEPTARTITA